MSLPSHNWALKGQGRFWRTARYFGIAVALLSPLWTFIGTFGATAGINTPLPDNLTVFCRARSFWEAPHRTQSISSTCTEGLCRQSKDHSSPGLRRLQVTSCYYDVRGEEKALSELFSMAQTPKAGKDKQTGSRRSREIRAAKYFESPTSSSIKVAGTHHHSAFRWTRCSHSPYAPVTTENRLFQTDI